LTTWGAGRESKPDMSGLGTMIGESGKPFTHFHMTASSLRRIFNSLETEGGFQRSN